MVQHLLVTIPSLFILTRKSDANIWKQLNSTLEKLIQQLIEPNSVFHCSFLGMGQGDMHTCPRIDTSEEFESEYRQKKHENCVCVKVCIYYRFRYNT
jgi:6-phosphogluconolactonase/glucosamine-6-phosphate isomerase/deaminase